MKKSPSTNSWIREIIQQQKSYHVPAAGDYIKLDAMENPWPMPVSLVPEWLEIMAEQQLNRYPDPAASVLSAKLRAQMQIPEESKIMLGNGSDELIQIIMMAIAGSDRKVLAPAPSFVMYEVLARACGLAFIGVPLQKDFTLDISSMRVAIEKYQPAVIFLASPNNPTGGLFQQQEIEEILDLAPGLVVVDEAYHPFVRDQKDNFMSRLVDYPDLIVMRTLSKVGLAGLRLGLIAGHETWVTELDKLRLPYNINSLSQNTATFALDHWSEYQQQIDEICSERDRVSQALSCMAGVETWHSDTNFILFRVLQDSAISIHAALLKQNIQIKCLHGASEQLQNCLRVTIGSTEENTYFLEQLSLLFNGSLNATDLS